MVRNTAEASGIITVDLLDFAPKEQCLSFDIKNLLYQGLIIREKEFKILLNDTNWELFRNKPVAIGCSEDTIIPPWVYMMLSSKLNSVNSRAEFCSPEELNLQLWKENIQNADFNHLANEKVVVRAHTGIAPSIFMKMTEKLTPVVQTLMYGEAGLPKVIWKRKVTSNQA
ncbi:DUF2480 family protein [Roseivirga pacifica]|uniref:DUF2480 family protein n=1 Tax=Roseivirga pacifica TaxID=1267423 RepID=UPI003BAF88EE